MIDLAPEYLDKVRTILRQHVPQCEVRAFGSRVSWTAKDYSDLDLAVVCSGKMGDDTLSRLREAFEESDLPFRVDVLDWHAISPEFQKVIEKQYEVVQEMDSKSAAIGWTQSTLGQVAEFISGGTPSKDNPSFWGGNLPWVSAKDMKAFLLYDSEDHLTDDGAKNATRVSPEGTVLLLTRGMTLLNDVPICVIRRPMAFNQDVKALRPRNGLRIEYLPYLLLGMKPRLLNLVDLAGHGTGRLNLDELKSLEIGFPPEKEQLSIAHILGTLDEKIELNRRMNETLEAMARALFKSWFVDFDPVRAKAEGRDPGLPKPLADLFPDSFEPSSVGRIPTGWREGRLDEMVLLQRGFDLPAPNRTPGPYPVMAASGPSGTHAEYKVKGPGITTGRSGVLGKVFLVHEDFWPLNTSLWVKEFRGARPIYAFHLLRGLDFEVFNAGSAVPTLNRNHVHGLPVVLPPLALVERFEEVVAPMYQKANRKEQESGTVAALRDTLLPKLVSGELRVKGLETTEALRHRG